MKYLAIITNILAFGLFLSACSQAKQPQNEAPEVSNNQLESVEKNTKPFNMDQLPGGPFSLDSFIAFKVYLSDGNILADSSRVETVRGKLNTGVKGQGFRIETRDANGRVLGAVYTENVFTYRSCDEGGQNTYIIKKGWIDVFVPYSNAIETIHFVDNDKSVQQISMKGVRGNMDKLRKGKR